MKEETASCEIAFYDEDEVFCQDFVRLSFMMKTKCFA